MLRILIPTSTRSQARSYLAPLRYTRGVVTCCTDTANYAMQSMG
jgi:hypothetical protein